MKPFSQVISSLSKISRSDFFSLLFVLLVSYDALKISYV